MLLAALLLAATAAAAPTPTPAATPGSRAVVLDRIAAVVGDEIILESEVRRLLEVGFDPRLPGESDAAFRERVLGDRITDLLRERQLRKTGGLEPDREEVRRELEGLIARVEKERGEPFDAVLARARVTRAEVEAWIRRDLALKAYVRERIAPTIKVTDEDVQAFYEGAEMRDLLRRNGVDGTPPLADVKDLLETYLRERKLNQEIDRWTADLRERTRVVIYRRDR